MVTDDRCFLIPAHRSDGVGIQAMLRICVMLLARQANSTYVHVPFIRLAHRKKDPIFRSSTPEKWAAKWESFFNLGKGEFHIADLANALGETTLTEHLSAKNRQFGFDRKVDRQDMLPNLMEKIRDHNIRFSGIYTFNLGLCQRSRENNLFLDAETIQILQDKFYNNSYRPEKMLYDEQYLNIAIHIRRGDVWDAWQAGSKKKMYVNKQVSEEYYVNLLHRLQKLFRSSSKPVRYHIFSDGRQDDFIKFTFSNEREAFLTLESGRTIENIQFHLHQNTLDTLYHMIKAPIFVPGKSTFSVVAVLLNNSYILYEDKITQFQYYSLLEKYMEGNPRFITLTRMKEKTKDVMKTLRDSKLMN